MKFSVFQNKIHLNRAQRTRMPFTQMHNPLLHFMITATLSSFFFFTIAVVLPTGALARRFFRANRVIAFITKYCRNAPLFWYRDLLTVYTKKIMVKLKSREAVYHRSTRASSMRFNIPRTNLPAFYLFKKQN